MDDQARLKFLESAPREEIERAYPYTWTRTWVYGALAAALALGVGSGVIAYFADGSDHKNLGWTNGFTVGGLLFLFALIFVVGYELAYRGEQREGPSRYRTEVAALRARIEAEERRQVAVRGPARPAVVGRRTPRSLSQTNILNDVKILNIHPGAEHRCEECGATVRADAMLSHMTSHRLGR